MEIEVGKFYKTRDGRKARIYAIDGGSGDMPHGAILSGEYWVSMAWFSNGATCLYEDEARDLVAPWIDKP